MVDPGHTCFLYNCFSIGLRVVFPYQTSENVVYWLIVDYFCDLVYLVDAVVVKPRITILKDGFLIVSFC